MTLTVLHTYIFPCRLEKVHSDRLISLVVDLDNYVLQLRDVKSIVYMKIFFRLLERGFPP